ncbi:hypothetical protein [Hymenobacter rubidus]|uniref:hypothetical protein n=1 Tax=Hymenobacter rubidus TaxID=1441626 RepID=UPI00191D0431|nr:hypothetical protein [Hymenobacter rubidus]
MKRFQNGYELKEYMASMQNGSLLNFTALNERLPWVYLLSIIGLLAGLAQPSIRQRIGPPGAMLLVLVGVALVSNAFVTGNLANVLDRLQVRMAWLLPFAALLLAAQHGPSLVAQGLRRLAAAARPAGPDA